MEHKAKKLKPHLEKYLIKRKLDRKWNKARFLLETNLAHPSLNFEKIIFKRAVFYSFRLDSKYRGICVLDKNVIEVVAFTSHYK